MRRTLVVLLGALLLGLGLLASSCGGGGGKSAGTDTSATTLETETGETETGDTGGTDTIVGDTQDFKNGLAICGNLPLDLLAQQYGVKAEEKTVARAVAAGAGPPSSKAYKETYAGCLAAIRGSRS